MNFKSYSTHQLNLSDILKEISSTKYRYNSNINVAGTHSNNYYYELNLLCTVNDSILLMTVCGKEIFVGDMKELR